MVKPIERVLRSGLFGPWDRPDIGPRRAARRRSTRPGTQAWGIDSFVFFPNFMILIWAPNWYLTYHYWPTSYNTHIFEGTLYFVPPKNARERLAPGAGRGDVQGVRAPGRQHARGHADACSSRGSVTEFPLSDQEILLRHLHKTARDYVDGTRQRTATVRQRPARAAEREGSRNV